MILKTRNFHMTMSEKNVASFCPKSLQFKMTNIYGTNPTYQISINHRFGKCKKFNEKILYIVEKNAMFQKVAK